MNRNLRFCSLLLLLLSCSAFGNVRVDLNFQPHNGPAVSHQLVLKPNYLEVDMVRISPHVYPALAPDIQRLARTKKTRAAFCSAGSYTHIVVVKGQRRQEQGCLESPSAQALKESVDRVRSLAFLRAEIR